MSALCPLCGGPLRQLEPWEFYTCDACQVLVEDSIAKPLEEKIVELFQQLSPAQQVDVFCELTKFVE